MPWWLLVAGNRLAQWWIGPAAGPLPCRGHPDVEDHAARNPTRAVLYL